jgi:hypothetical protein
VAHTSPRTTGSYKVCPTYCSRVRLDAPKSVVDKVVFAQLVECRRIVSERRVRHCLTGHGDVFVWCGECGEGERTPSKRGICEVKLTLGARDANCSGWPARRDGTDLERQAASASPALRNAPLIVAGW